MPVADDPGQRRGRLELIEMMLLHEAAQTVEPYRGHLNLLIERVMLLLAPFRGDELYRGRESDDESTTSTGRARPLW